MEKPKSREHFIEQMTNLSSCLDDFAGQSVATCWQTRMQSLAGALLCSVVKREIDETTFTTLSQLVASVAPKKMAETATIFLCKIILNYAESCRGALPSSSMSRAALTPESQVSADHGEEAGTSETAASAAKESEEAADFAGFDQISMMMLSNDLGFDAQHTKPLDCKKCGYICFRQTILNKHMADEHANDSDADSKPEARKSRNPADPRPYMCKHCGAVLSSQQHYASHVRHMHPPSPSSQVKDLVCHSEVIVKKEPADASDKSHKQYRCRLCGKVFENAPGIAGHTRHCMLAHGGEASPNVNARSERKRKLDELTANGYPTSRSEHFAQRGLDSVEALTCTYCNVLFKSIHAVDRHVKAKHSDVRQEIYRCSSSKCRRVFMTLGGIENHWLYYLDCPDGVLEIVTPSGVALPLAQAEPEPVAVRLTSQESLDMMDEEEEEEEEERENGVPSVSDTLSETTEEAKEVVEQKPLIDQLLQRALEKAAAAT